MCYYITMVLPKDADPGRVARVLARHGITPMEVKNPHVDATLPTGMKHMRAARQYCDCDTALGRLRLSEHDRFPDPEPLRRKGWSEAKIQRWLAQKRSQPIERTADPDGWCRVIRDLLEEARASRAGLLLHMYDDGLEEKIILEPIRKLVADETLADELHHMQEDTIYLIRKGIPDKVPLTSN